MTHVEDDALVDLAALAFRLGLEHGRQRAKPMDGFALRDWLRDSWPMQANCRYHRTKIRQVYGAGFDISRVEKVMP